MKRILLVALCLSLLVGAAFAQEMVPGTNKKTADTAISSMPMPATRTAPAYTFTKTPTSLMTSYYDYMIGSYNGLPLRAIPAAAGGGYFLTYHGQRTATGQRRAFYGYLDASGNVITNSEITSVVNREGYSTMTIDPVSGKPFYAWHANTDADAELEVQVTSDAFIAGIPGLFNDLQVIAENPTSITATSGSSTDNEFIWPTAQIGPSPVNGKRRIYVIMRNAVTHSYGPSENPLIAYADFDGDDIEGGIPLVWSTTTIPEMDNWNHDATWRRPFHALTTDNAGNIYYVGYHFATEADGTTDIPEPDMDVFKCGNYGQGTWTRISAWSKLASWNPDESPTSTTGYFTSDATGLPYTDEELYWQITNSSHLNATVDDNGVIHAPALWGLNNAEGFYYPAMQYMKEFVFDPNASAENQFKINEIWPQSADTTPGAMFQPWDLVAPFGVVDSWTEYTDGWAPDIADSWDFPYWDQAAHSEAMFFHYSNMKITEGNDHGMLATVWQNCLRSKWFNVNGDTDYSAWSNTPEIFISVSPDNGYTWSEPIKLNNIEVPEFATLKPMWVYPADKVLYVDEVDGHKVGKLGIMFYNDFTWGSNSITPPVHPTADGGQVMFTELQITFPLGWANDDNTVTPVANLLNQNYPNPFNPETTISFDMPKAAPANLSIYNVKGQLVKTLFDGTAAYGKNSVVWNGTDNSGSKVSSGIYFYNLNANGNVESRKMMLMK